MFGGIEPSTSSFSLTYPFTTEITDHLHIFQPVIQHCTEVRFASFLSGRFTIMAVINPPEKNLAKRTL